MADHRTPAETEVTRLLRACSDGRSSFDELVPVVYRELKTIARAQLRRSGRATPVETTMLVHEAYEKLVKGETQRAKDRHHFYAIAARAMRHIIIDSYRAESAAKRGGMSVPNTLLTSDLVDFDTPDSMLQFEQAMQRLSKESEELAEVVDLSCFGGLSNQEIAELTGANVRTVQRQLARAQAWIDTFLAETCS